jgi:hypothetical protein
VGDEGLDAQVLGRLRIAAKVASQLPCAASRRGGLVRSPGVLFLAPGLTPSTVAESRPGRPLAVPSGEERIIGAGRCVLVGALKARAGAVDLTSWRDASSSSQTWKKVCPR